SLRAISVIPNRFHWTSFFGLFATSFLFGILGLLIDKRIAAIIVPFEIVGGCFAAQITVDALVIDVILARDVFGIPVCNVSHKIRRMNLAICASSHRIGKSGKFT